MNVSKFESMVREFPFLRKLFACEHLSAETIEEIRVQCVDRNLLEARPGSWNYDAGSFNNAGFRNFWVVCPGEIFRLKDAHYKDTAYVGGGWVREAGLIGNQLVELLDREIDYIVESTNEWYDWADSGPVVIVYKMKNFDWQRFCGPAIEQHQPA